jgi:hypothetical protein
METGAARQAYRLRRVSHGANDRSQLMVEREAGRGH